MVLKIPSAESRDTLNKSGHSSIENYTVFGEIIDGPANICGLPNTRARSVKTRREIFLERMDALIPWEQMEERIRPFYPKDGARPSTI